MSPITSKELLSLFHVNNPDCEISYLLVPKKLPIKIPPLISYEFFPVPPLLTDNVPSVILVAFKEVINLTWIFHFI